MHLLRGLRGDETLQRLPELRRRLCAAPDQANAGMATGRVHDEAGTVGQAGASEVQPGGRRGALRADTRGAAGEAVDSHHVIARSPCDEAIQTAAAERLWNYARNDRECG